MEPIDISLGGWWSDDIFEGLISWEVKLRKGFNVVLWNRAKDKRERCICSCTDGIEGGFYEPM